MKVLLTGATGLIGQALGKELVRRGHAVRTLVRDPKRARAQLPFPSELFAWSDVTTPLPEGALEGIEGIIHLAGEPVAERRWTAEHKARVRASRVEGTKRFADAIGASPVGKRPTVFVLGAAVGIYGDRGDELLSETSSQGSDFLADVCVDWEKQAKPIVDCGVRVPIVRTGIVLSQSGGALAKMLPVFEAGIGGRLGSGRQFMSWIHLEDIVGLFVFALENPGVQGALNGVAPTPVSNSDFTRELARALGRRVFLPVPSLSLRLAFGEMAVVLLGGQRASSQKAQDLGYVFKYPVLGPALDELVGARRAGVKEIIQEQWVPRPVEQVFPFFSDERNLESLTPKFLNFSVLGKSTETIREGTLIDYRLSLHGIPFSWRTKIEEWTPGKRFVDTQLKGPYRLWHHTHEFETLGNGTLIRDRVLYKVPLGFLGALVAGAKVSGDVARIFAYRREKIGEIYG